MKYLIFVSFLIYSTTLLGQPDTVKVSKSMHSSKEVADFYLGIGVGLDCGGVGVNLLVYPQENIGIFGGIGYAFAGLGLNGG